MTAEEEARLEKLGARAVATLTDALAPVLGDRGIVAVSIVALVATDDVTSMPVTVSMGVGQEAVAAVEAARADVVAAGEISGRRAFVIPMPVKQ